MGPRGREGVPFHQFAAFRQGSPMTSPPGLASNTTIRRSRGRQWCRQEVNGGLAAAWSRATHDFAVNDCFWSFGRDRGLLQWRR